MGENLEVVCAGEKLKDEIEGGDVDYRSATRILVGDLSRVDRTNIRSMRRAQNNSQTTATGLIGSSFFFLLVAPIPLLIPLSHSSSPSPSSASSYSPDSNERLEFILLEVVLRRCTGGCSASSDPDSIELGRRGSGMLISCSHARVLQMPRS